MSLALTRLDLSHFRSHRRTTLDLDPRPVAIFGPNGAGKTNLIEAISLLSPGRGLRRATSDDLARSPDRIGWRIVADLTHGPRQHQIDARAEAGSPRQTRIDGKAAPQNALGSLLRILWLVPSMDRLWSEGAEGRRRFLDRIALSFQPGHADAVLAYDKAMRDRNRLLRDQITDTRWYAALEFRMAEAGTALAANRAAAIARLQQAQTGAITAFPAADLALSDPAPFADAAAFAAALADARPGDLRAGRSRVGPHRVDLDVTFAAKAMPAALCSTGEQKALLISLILANARALAEDTGTAPILLLDEVAAHLDADRRAALYDEVCTLGAQAFLTGTGAELFDSLGNRTQRLEVTEVDGESRVRCPDR
ncbi:DNA replication/repair protein RecF [Pseudoruegeria sp. SK021]|uniref:DNA replication/repair protein RecF n=1 Tax=Pseudoruegeria sp. SK021 TaxID=1933035 RepID=UPI000A21DB0D|nr:DNA replication/repair protein RecF [Pseudoruegeria sp. SK021]OSP54729.1 DNA replication/repair protein RecF [Pseudoruegeria sp. SK021]